MSFTKIRIYIIFVILQNNYICYIFFKDNIFVILLVSLKK